ncbi:hypothetical protein M8J77_003762 [Diaphorina citri]|nr:hypothetical protein M8J77_003762 [Diaphorina citri]
MAKKRLKLYPFTVLSVSSSIVKSCPSRKERSGWPCHLHAKDLAPCRVCPTEDIIAPPDIRREVASDVERKKQMEDPRHSLHDHQPITHNTKTQIKEKLSG